MAPAVPTPSAATTSKLPISRAALTALDKCRRPHPFHTTAELSTTVVSAALSEGNTLTTAPAKYVMRRLLTGVSVSSGAARLNYSLILTALTRQLVAKGGKNAPDDCVKAVKNVYGPEGSFDVRYVGALRERALGTVACIAAVVRACEGVKCSASAVRDIVAMLRSVVDADAAKWRLARAAIGVMERVLPLVKTRDKDAVLKPLWAWCEAHLKKEDGLQLALLLQEKGLISNDAFVRLYPSLEGDVIAALMDTFEGGFTSVAEDMFQSEGSEKEAWKYVVPLGWRMSVEYALTEKGTRHWGGIAKFWRKAVFESLLESSKSAEKKLLALELINIVLDHIHNEECFQSIFDKSLSSTIRLFLSNHAHQRRRNGSAQIRAKQTNEYVMRQLSQSARRLGESILTRLCKESKKKKERSRLMCEALLWALRGGILFKLFSSDLPARSLKLLSREDVSHLLSGIISRFAKPLKGARSLKIEKKRNIYQRHDAVRLLFAVAREHPYLLKDIITVVVLYSLFQQVDSDSGTEEKIPVAFEYLDVKRFGVEDSLYLGLLPKAEPDLNPEILSEGFRQLVQVLTEQRNGELFQDTLTFCVSIIRKVSDVDRSFCLPRASTPTIAVSTGAKESRDLQSVAWDVIDQLSGAQSSGDGSPMFGALRTLTKFFYIYMFEPRGIRAESGEGRQELTSNYISFMKIVASTSQLLCQAGEHQEAEEEPKNGEKIQEPIEPAEHIAHLITELCGRDAPGFRQVALIAVQELGRSIDDKVIAVFFDSMDSYLQEGESIEEEDDSEDEMETGEAIGDKGDNFSADNVSDPEQDVIKDDEEEGSEEEDGNDGGESSKRGPSGQDLNNLAKLGGNGEGKGSDSDSDDDVGMDIDDEDPSVLEKFDKVIGAHLGLLREEKKITKARKKRAAFRFVKVSRVLSIIEVVSRMLRLALEKWHEDDPKLPLVFMDLHVRLYEFALGEESKSSRFLKEVGNIVSKQLLLPHSAFDGKISDSQTALEISDRFFALLRTPKADRKGEVEVMRTVSRSAQIFLSIAEKVSKNAHSRYLPIYNELLDSMLRKDFHFWTPDVFRSFVQTAPEISLKFLQPIDNALKSEELTRTKRSYASNLILMISTEVSNSSNICTEDAKTFWELVTTLVQRECTGNALRKKWSGPAFGEMVRVVANGLAGGHMSGGHDVASTLASELDKFSFGKQERSRLFRMLKSPKQVAMSNPESENEMVSKKRHQEEPKHCSKAEKKRKN